MMHLAPGRWPAAAGVGASAVPGGHRPAQPVGDGAGGPADVEGLALAVQHDRHHRGVAAQHPQRLRGDRAAEVQTPGPGPVLQVLEPDQHVHVRAVPAAVGEHRRRGVVEHVPAHVGQRLGLPLPGAAVVVARSAAWRGRRSPRRSRRTSPRRRTGPSPSRRRRAAGSGTARSPGPGAGRRAAHRPDPAARPAPCPTAAARVGVYWSALPASCASAPAHASGESRPAGLLPRTRAITSTCRSPVRPAANTSAVAGSRAGNTRRRARSAV